VRSDYPKNNIEPVRQVIEALQYLHDAFPAVREMSRKQSLDFLHVSNKLPEGDEAGAYYGDPTGSGAPVTMIIYANGLRGASDSPVLGEDTVIDSVHDAVRHETGHRVYDAMTPRDRKAWGKLFKDRSDWASVSDYAATNYDEAFAESVTAYTHPNYKGGLPKPVERFLARVLGKNRPVANAAPEWESFLRADSTANIFCPTGEGGGVDPSCSPGGAKLGGTGTKDDPVRVGADIRKAAAALAEGKWVHLSQPEQVSTLVRRLGKMVRRAASLGEEAPTLDLCKVSVEGTNLFCQDTLGIPRVEMPQLRGVPEPGSRASRLKAGKSGKVDASGMFVRHLEKRGVGVGRADVRASRLRASQKELIGARVAQLVNEARSGERDLRDKRIFVTNDNYILDGHHHWAALVATGAGAGKDYKVPVYRIDMGIADAFREAKAYAKRIGMSPKSAVVNPRPSANAWEPFDPPDVAANAGANCGTGAGGFQPGNTCARDGGESGAGSGPSQSSPRKCPPPCDRPSLPEERTPGVAPKALKWRNPPPKKGKKGTKGHPVKVVRPVGDDSQTRIGDQGESLAAELGFRSILPSGKRSFTAAEVKKKGSSIDLEYDHSGRLYELKICNTTSTEYRLKAKKEEKDAKLKYARLSRAEAYVLIGVRDPDKGMILFYAAKDPGMTGANVSKKAFDYVGRVKY
jgi:hypothetical protein